MNTIEFYKHTKDDMLCSLSNGADYYAYVSLDTLGDTTMLYIGGRDDYELQLTCPSGNALEIYFQKLLNDILEAPYLTLEWLHENGFTQGY